MSIYVSQGHEHGIGLEVFFKSCLLLSSKVVDSLEVLAYQSAIESTLKSLKLPFHVTHNSIVVSGRSIRVHWLTNVEHSQSFTSLKEAMRLTRENRGILYTLPTAKDQFPQHPGHTEYFRSVFNMPNLGMFFSSTNMQVLLISDHIALKDVTNLSEETIYTRMKTAIRTLSSWNWPIERILVSGFNPHAGENGLIGSEDSRITSVIARLKEELQFNMAGPFPGDTMCLEQTSARDLLVYLYHDQGLGVFKGLQGFIGSNITLGLPYPRFSPDHGTSFSLFGKNKADYRGCAYSLKEAFFLLENLKYGKNPSHQS